MLLLVTLLQNRMMSLKYLRLLTVVVALQTSSLCTTAFTTSRQNTKNIIHTPPFSSSFLHVKQQQNYQKLSPRHNHHLLRMGFLDNISSFLGERDGDFVKLEKTQSAFGPGPALLLYKVPLGIDDDEVFDILQDGAPQAFDQGIALQRIQTSADGLLDLKVELALQQVLEQQNKPPSRKVIAYSNEEMEGCPVLFFSGFQNEEMMSTYEILAYEIYQETGGLSPACAKAVPNAMEKSLRQVVEEISNDHSEAMALEQKQEQPQA